MTVINSNRVVRGPVTAIPLVAGKGVKITADTVNNRYVAEVDETVLWEGTSSGANPTFSLSESMSNFEYIEFHAVDIDGWVGSVRALSAYCTTDNRITVPIIHNVTGGKGVIMRYIYVHPTSTTALDAAVFGFDYSSNSTSNDKTHMVKIVGINRIASN